MQGSSPAIQGSKVAVQTTISSQRLQGTRATTITIRALPRPTTKPAARTRDNSTARPVGVVTKIKNMALDIGALPPYALYYGARLERHAITNHMPSLKGSVVDRALLAEETMGLGGDVIFDRLKGEEIGDEGKRGCTLPLHSYIGPCGPYVYLPGIHDDGTIDW